MRVAVVGAGLCGLVAARRLALDGHGVDVYERWNGLGGQAATLDVGGGLRLERYYHHLFTSDRHIAALYDELGMPDELEWRRSSMAFFVQGRQWAFTTPLDLLRFRPLKPWSRLRMGLAVLRLQRGGDDVGPYEGITARSWITRAMGREAYDTIWGPLLRGKFGDRADDISMAWLWSKLTLRRRLEGAEAREERLGYPRGSWETLFAALREQIEAHGGRVLLDRPAARLSRSPGGGFGVTAAAAGSYRRGHDPRSFDPDGEPERYDAVIATVPSDVFAALLDPALAAEVGDGYLGRLQGHRVPRRAVPAARARPAVLAVLLDERGRPAAAVRRPDRADELRRLRGAALPLRRELPRARPRAARPRRRRAARALRGGAAGGQSRVRSPAWIRNSWLFREPHAQPIVTVGYRERIPPLETGAAGLLLANTTQIYPEDRGTNYAVREGESAAAQLTSRSLPVSTS